MVRRLVILRRLVVSGCGLWVRPGEFEDLEAIAEAWGVPIATVTWAIVADQLSRWRKVPLELGSLTIPLVAARRVLERVESRGRAPAAERPEPPDAPAG